MINGLAFRTYVTKDLFEAQYEKVQLFLSGLGSMKSGGFEKLELGFHKAGASAYF